MQMARELTVTEPTPRPAPWPRPRVLAAWMLVFVALNVVWRLIRCALNFPIWGDEAFVAISFLHRDFAGLARPLEYGQFAPLLYMWSELACVRALGVSEWTLRLSALLVGLATPWLFWSFARQTLDRRSALLAVGIFCASYYPVRHSVEVKPYAGDLFMAVVLMLMAIGVRRRPDSLARWLVLIATAAAGLWFSYTVAFVGGAVGWFVLSIAWSRRRAQPHLLLHVGVYGWALGASFLAMYWFFARPQRAAAEWITTIPTWLTAFPPVGEPWRLPAWFVDIHTGNMAAYPVGGNHGGSALTFLLIVAGVVVTWKRDRALLWLLLGPLPLMFAAAAVKAYPYGSSARVCLFLAAPFCWLAGAGLMGIFRWTLRPRRIPAAISVAVGALLVIAVAGVIRDVIKPYKTVADRENRRVIRELAARSSPGDVWVVYNRPGPGEFGVGFSHYGGYGARFRLYVELLSPNAPRWAPDPATVTEAPGAGVWLLVFHDARGGASPCEAPEFTHYLETLTARLGPAAEQRYTLDESEWIRVYRFGGPRAELSPRGAPPIENELYGQPQEAPFHARLSYCSLFSSAFG